MRRSSLLILLAALLLAAAVPAPAAPPVDLLDRGWSSASAPPGFNGDVRSLLSYEGNLYVGGSFQGAGAAAMSHVGRWNGAEWSGVGEGFNHAVLCLAGFRGDLVAGGLFTASGPDSLSHLARWDGEAWRSVGGGLGAPVTAAVEHDGALYVASYSRCVARAGYRGRGACEDWDPSLLARWNDDDRVWTPLATAEALDGLQLLGTPRDLVVFNGRVVVAAPVRAPGDLHDMLYPAAILVDGRWEPFGPGVADIPGVQRPFAKSLLVDGDRIFLAGLFPGVESAVGESSRLVEGDGTAWTSLDPGFSGAIYALARDGDRLVVAGDLMPHWSRGDRITGVHCWDGETWTLLTSESYGWVWALAEHDGALFAGGSFTRLDQEPVWNLGRHDGNGWVPAAEQDHAALPGPVYALASSGGTLLARADSRAARQIWALRNGVWRGFDEDPLSAPSTAPMSSLTLSKYNGTTAEVRFPILEQDSRLYAYDGWRGHLSAWDAETGWRRVSQVLSWYEHGQYWYESDVTALGAWRGHLVVGGLFGRIDEVEVQNIALRDGQTWVPLGGGLGFECSPDDDDCFFYFIRAALFCRVRAMVDYQGDLVVAGSFNRAGGKKCLNVARWDGAEWHRLGDGLNDVVMDLAVVGEDLYAAGYFAGAGTDWDIDHVARWDGERWQALDGGTDAPALCLEVYNGQLFVGGLFRRAGRVFVRHLAAWDGKSWLSVGSGTNGAVNDLLVLDGDLYAGGEFTEAGGAAAFHVARWTEPAAGAVVTDLAAERTAGGVELRWTLAGIAFRFDGFHVYRETFRGERERLTALPLAGSYEYTFTDSSPLLGRNDYWIVAVGRDGRETPLVSLTVDPVAGIPLALAQNHPNPFRGGPAGEITRIRFSVPEAGPVRLRVLDIAGREVALLLDAPLPAGEYEVPWTGLDGKGRQVAAGMYFYRLESSRGGLVRKVVVLD